VPSPAVSQILFKKMVEEPDTNSLIIPLYPFSIAGIKLLFRYPLRTPFASENQNIEW
jgi:hypothetical protein